jgi:hypothetical protein
MKFVVGVIDKGDIDTWDVEGLVVDGDEVELMAEVGFSVIEVGDSKVSVTEHPANSIRIRLIDRKQRNFIHLLIFHIYFHPVLDHRDYHISLRVLPCQFE